MGLLDLFKKKGKDAAAVVVVDAIGDARAAALASPADPFLLTRYAAMLLKAGQVGDAAIEFGKVAAMLPTDPVAQFNYAVACEDSGDLEQAVVALRRVVELDPEDSLAYNHLGAIYLDRNDYARAEEALRRAVELNSDSAIANNNLGVVLKKLGRDRDAAHYFDRALAIDPTLVQAKVELAEVRERAAAEPESGKFVKGLNRTKVRFLEWFKPFAGAGVEADQAFYDGLFEHLILADVGGDTADELLDYVRARSLDEGSTRAARAIELLRGRIEAILNDTESIEPFTLDRLNVIMLVGVNGVGKTTVLAKIANHLKERGMSVLIAAADTFRAAAVDQLKIWAERTGTPLIAGQQSADPAAVVFDATKAAIARGVDVLLIDTAGRLQTKKNLMAELQKIERTISKNAPDANVHHLLCLDANTGQNAISQVELFKSVCRVRGLIVNKLDGTARGGAIITIVKKHRIPVLFIGVGEKVNDLVEFDAHEYTKAWFSG